MFRFALRHAPIVCFLAVAFVSGCGGATLGEGQTPRGDGGEPHDAATKDATRTKDVNPGVDVSPGVDVVESPDAACTPDPTEGAACNPAVSTACPQSGNACCIGYVWECNSATRTWVKEGLGCACVIADAGVAVDSGGTGSDASDACGGCAAGDVCVVTTSSGGACMRPGDGGVCPNGQVIPPDQCCDNTTVTAACERRPGACGGGLSCACAATLCACECLSTLGSTVECACFAP